MTLSRKNGIRFQRCDAAALLLCAAVFGFLLFCAPRGMGTPDESFYFTIPQRILAGDRLLADEWQVSQFSALLQLLPYRLYTRLTGGTEGIVLFFRYLYIFCGFCIFWFLYFFTRGHGAPAAAAAALFSLSAQNAIFTLNYYTMAVQALAVCCVLLFCGDRAAGVPRCVAAGVVFGCAVIAQPPLLVLWVPFAAYCIARARKNRRSGAAQPVVQLAAATLGAAICAAAVLLFLLKTTGPDNMLRALPELFTDANHGFFSENGTVSQFFRKIVSACGLYGTFWLILASAACSLALLYRIFRMNSALLRTALFAILCAAVCGAYLHALLYLSENAKATRALSFHGFPLLPYGAGIFFLNRENDKKTAPFFIAGCGASVCVDLFSDISLGFGGSLTLIYTVPAFARIISDCVKTLRERGKEKRMTVLLPAVLSIVCAFSAAAGFCGWQHAYCRFCLTPVYERTVSLLQTLSGIPLDTALSTRLKRGPLKGTRTTAWLAGCYDATLEDVDRITALCEGRFCVAAPYAYIYLYAALPYGTYSAYYNEANAADRLERYWELFPEKKAEYLYFPREYLTLKFPFPTAAVEAFSQKHACVAEKGKAGYIVRVCD